MVKMLWALSVVCAVLAIAVIFIPIDMAGDAPVRPSATLATVLAFAAIVLGLTARIVSQQRRSRGMPDSQYRAGGRWRNW
jgi:hypothetical protein